jgi:hypothetical protein
MPASPWTSACRCAQPLAWRDSETGNTIAHLAALSPKRAQTYLRLPEEWRASWVHIANAAGQSPLWLALACPKPSLPVIEDLCRQGADWHAAPPSGVPAWRQLAPSYRLPRSMFAQLLPLFLGSPIQTQDTLMTLATWALHHRHARALGEMLVLCPSLDTMRRGLPWGANLLASGLVHWSNHRSSNPMERQMFAECVDLLLSRGVVVADVEHRLGRSLVDWAMEARHVEVLEVVLRHHACPWKLSEGRHWNRHLSHRAMQLSTLSSLDKSRRTSARRLFETLATARVDLDQDPSDGSGPLGGAWRRDGEIASILAKARASREHERLHASLQDNALVSAPGRVRL